MKLYVTLYSFGKKRVGNSKSTKDLYDGNLENKLYCLMIMMLDDEQKRNK